MSDNWDFYSCRVDDRPASIFVDLGIRADVPDDRLPRLAWLRLQLRFPRDDGLSEDREFDDLMAVEDALTEAISASEAQAMYVGRNTSDGSRDFFCYCDNVVAIEAALADAMAGFPSYEFVTGERDDPDWSCYLQFLYPTPRAMETIENRSLLNQLRAHGDTLEVRRPVTHWVYFQRSEDRENFARRCGTLGYAFADDDTEDGSLRLRVERTDSVQPDDIDRVVLELFDLATECRGNYDGWETSVE